jgi:flagellin
VSYLGTVDTSFAAYVISAAYSSSSNPAATTPLMDYNNLWLADNTDTALNNYDKAAAVIQYLLHGQIADRLQADSNANAAISMVQTFDDAVDEISVKLSQMKDLAVKAGDEFYNDTEKAAMQTELETLITELNAIVDSTESVGNKLLTSAGETISVSLGNSLTIGSYINIHPEDLSFEIANLDLTIPIGADAAQAAIEAQIEKVDDYSQYLSGQITRLDSVSSLIEFDVAGIGADISTLDITLAMEIAVNAMNKITANTATLTEVQSGFSSEMAFKLLYGTSYD